MDCQKNKLNRRSSLAELLGGFDSGEYWHDYIQHNHVWLKSLRLRDQIPPVFGGPDDFKIHIQKRHHSFEHEAVVVGEENSRTRSSSHKTRWFERRIPLPSRY